MPPKRKNSSDSASEPPTKKAAKGGSKAPPKTKTEAKAKASAPRLRRSIPPKWDKPEYSDETPTGKWSKKCVERWRERSALDRVNTIGSDESKMVKAEDLCGDIWDFLRCASGDVAAVIYGSVLDNELRKTQIGRTLFGSLYLTEVSGCDDGGSVREICAMSRLYSAFGLGTSIDLSYSYYVRMRILSSGQRFGSLNVCANTIDDCDPKEPQNCKAMVSTPGFVPKKAPDAITVFRRSGTKSSSTTAANIKSLEEPLFGCEGWLSPLKLTNILFAAVGVMGFNEDDTDTPKSTLAKFQFFQGKNDGKLMLKEEVAKLNELEEELDDDEVCVPQRLLALVREEGDAEERDEEEQALGTS
ncbi:hypothetical protein FRC07_003904 [Ceratobasidium sp. 392]|nr:hypothetical protein FRC07_003904 [Ceratobasidium sp. 392]